MEKILQKLTKLLLIINGLTKIIRFLKKRGKERNVKKRLFWQTFFVYQENQIEIVTTSKIKCYRQCF